MDQTRVNHVDIDASGRGWITVNCDESQAMRMGVILRSIFGEESFIGEYRKGSGQFAVAYRFSQRVTYRIYLDLTDRANYFDALVKSPDHPLAIFFRSLSQAFKTPQMGLMSSGEIDVLAA